MVDVDEAKQVCRAASSVVYPELDFGIKPCRSYTREEDEHRLRPVRSDARPVNGWRGGY